MLGAIAERGLVLLGCGRMGSAMLSAWLERGLAPDAAWVIEPAPSNWLLEARERGLRLNEGLPDAPAAAVVAVKPQSMGEALPALEALGGGATVFVSIAAGTTVAALESVLGAKAPVVRAMPNTPAAIGQGVSAIVGGARADAAAMDLADSLLAAVGQVVRLEDESQMDAVTAVSGSGPAYVFHLVETLAAAGAAEGLPEGLAMDLAKATVAGAGALAAGAGADPAALRADVTSPGGTTEAALRTLMDGEAGFPALMRAAVAAAAERSRELAR